jgi:peptidoglycan/xylan/chitin deacetylase (PgdA/CDA1 family)
MLASVAPLDVSWVDRLAATVGRVAGTRGAVLCFHGLDVEGAPAHSSMHVPAALLEGVVEAVHGLGTLVPLRDIVGRYLEGRSTAGLVALTADDGYASWLTAEPFLTRHGIPLTVFAVSDALATGWRFWWDRIDESAPRAHPERWRRFEDECGLPTAYRVGQPSTEGPARPMRQWILAEHAGRWPRALENPMVRLEEELGPPTAQRSMTVAEFSGFLERTGADVGVHTVSHAALPFLSDDEMGTEIREGYKTLRGGFRRTLPYLAIPFGLFDARTLRVAGDAGMKVSLTLAGCALDRPFAAELGMPRVCVVRQHAPGVLALKASPVAALLGRLRGDEALSYPVLPSPTT